ncbi:MAG: glucoamylase family protein [Saprospiraceae bacterium]
MIPTALLVLSGLFFMPHCSAPPTVRQPPAPAEVNSPPALPPYSTEELRRRTFNYFWELADSVNYQIPDRYPRHTFSSIAATGFGLASYLVGVERGYVTREEAARRVLLTLRTLNELPKGEAASGTAGYRGFFYHFLTYEHATRFKDVELSTIDTGLLMAGILTVMSYFDREDDATETELRRLADRLYRAVEWDWAMNDRGRISMGWRPEKGFIPHDWHGYNEAMILLILALGSPTHPVPAAAWQEWCSTYDWGTYGGQKHLNFEPLFGHQYSHIFIDFRGIRDDYMRGKNSDYFENSRRATLANRAWCMENPHGYEDYGPLTWGLTACDGPAREPERHTYHGRPFRSYSARGPEVDGGFDDGTIAPTAAGGSIPFAPEICLPTLEHLWNTYGDRLVGEYGFRDAFNPSYTFGPGNESGWFDTDYLGIDQGPILLQLENHETGLIWEVMKRNPYVRAGLERAGFLGEG